MSTQSESFGRRQEPPVAKAHDCIPARVAVLQLRQGARTRKVEVVFPSRWPRAALLAYARRQHPGETVRIVEWHDVTAGSGWEPARWIVNPAAFSDFRLGVMYEEARALTQAALAATKKESGTRDG